MDNLNGESELHFKQRMYKIIKSLESENQRLTELLNRAKCCQNCRNSCYGGDDCRFEIKQISECINNQRKFWELR